MDLKSESADTTPLARAKIGLALVALAIAVYLLPTALAPLTYPPFYEDEPWVFLPMIEFARGNGLSFGALGEGQAPSLIFGVLTAPLVWVSPLDVNLTIRLIAALACVFVLITSYLVAAPWCARRLHGPSGADGASAFLRRAALRAA